MVAVAVGVVAVAGLIVGAQHGARQQAALARTSSARAWQLDARYWSCLDAQARSLAPRESHVWLDFHNLGEEILLQKVFVPWTVEVAHRGQAAIWISLRSGTGRGSCLGSKLQATYPRINGTPPLFRNGTGGSFPGKIQELPMTPL